MRIIHTSDWHLGQHFMGKTRLEEHQAFLHWLLELIRAEKAEGLVVSGDVFDTGAPPSYARTLYNEFIVALQDTPLRRAVVLGGNHDSAATLNEGKQLLACLKTSVVAGAFEDVKDHVIEIPDRDGRPGLIVCALPYLRPQELLKSRPGTMGQEKQSALAGAIESFYDRVFEAAVRQRDELTAQRGGRPLPIMATGHLTVTGGTTSESVRDIYIGGLDAFSARGFPDADYIALGHLHKAQAVKANAPVRYSGSPIPLSFSEAAGEKQVIQVDFFQDGAMEITPVRIPCFRSLVSLEGNLKTIGKELAAMKAGGSPPAESGVLTPWLEVVVTGDDFLSNLTEQVQDLIQKNGPKDLELLRVRRARKNREPGFLPEKTCRLEDLNPREVFLQRLEMEDLDPDRAGALKEMFDQVLNQVMTREQQAGGDQ